MDTRAFTLSAVFALAIFSCLKISEAEVRKEDMFPYGPGNGDSSVARILDGSTPVQLKTPFKFFKKDYTTAFVGTNGIVSFKTNITTYTPICGALPEDFNGTMIAPYWADSDLEFQSSSDSQYHYERGAVYYRETDDLALQQKAIADIKKAFPDIPSVDSTSLFIVTWDDIPYYLTPRNTCHNSKTTNTFQLILSTDDVRSFAIVYYNELTWSASQGKGGEFGDCYGLNGIPAKAGFDVGDGETFYEIPGTCTEDVLHLTQTSNMGEAGKWIFGVNDDFVAPEPEPTTSEPTTATTTQPPTTAPPPSPTPTAPPPPPTTTAPPPPPTTTAPPPPPTTTAPPPPTITTTPPPPPTTTTTTEAPPQEFSCKSRADGLYPNVGNCRTFYKCSNEYRYLYDCPANLNYDYVSQFCDWPETARCATEYE